MKPSTEYAFDYWGVKELTESAETGEPLPPVDGSAASSGLGNFPRR